MGIDVFFGPGNFDWSGEEPVRRDRIGLSKAQLKDETDRLRTAILELLNCVAEKHGIKSQEEFVCLHLRKMAGYIGWGIPFLESSPKCVHRGKCVYRRVK